MSVFGYYKGKVLVDCEDWEVEDTVANILKSEPFVEDGIVEFEGPSSAPNHHNWMRKKIIKKCTELSLPDSERRVMFDGYSDHAYWFINVNKNPPSKTYNRPYGDSKIS
jgi:hypothetical protein